MPPWWWWWWSCRGRAGRDGLCRGHPGLGQHHPEGPETAPRITESITTRVRQREESMGALVTQLGLGLQTDKRKSVGCFHVDRVGPVGLSSQPLGTAAVVHTELIIENQCKFGQNSFTSSRAWRCCQWMDIWYMKAARKKTNNNYWTNCILIVVSHSC